MCHTCLSLCLCACSPGRWGLRSLCLLWLAAPLKPSPEQQETHSHLLAAGLPHTLKISIEKRTCNIHRMTIDLFYLDYKITSCWSCVILVMTRVGLAASTWSSVFVVAIKLLNKIQSGVLSLLSAPYTVVLSLTSTTLSSSLAKLHHKITF